MSTNLHVLFLCGWYPSRVLPNNGDFIQRHAEAVRLKHSVSVIHIISDPNLIQSIELISEEINSIPTHIAYVKPSKNKIVKVFRFYKAFKLLLQQVGSFDIVHLNKLFPFGILALFLKWNRDTPYLISEHWTGYHAPQVSKITLIEKFFSKQITKKAKFICPVSRNLQFSMEKIGLHGNYYPVPNVVNTSLFSVKTKKTESPFTIVHASNMVDAHKNISGILNTIAEFKNYTQDFKLILIGENSKQYKPLAEKLQIETYVEFQEHIPHSEIAKHIQNADVFVLFSNYENLPCVILESFSCGTPVISTNVGGISEYFPDEFGYLIPVNNEKELHEKLQLVHQQSFSPKKLHEYAEKKFSKAVIAETFSNLYTK